MPLLRFDVIEGRDEKSLQLLLDTAHQAMVEAFGVPERDRYQIVHQHPANELIIQDAGLGFQRTKDMVIISMTSKARTESQKEKLYALLAERLEKKCEISLTTSWYLLLRMVTQTGVSVSVRRNF